MTSSVIFSCCTLYCMSQIYGMESPLDTAQSQTVWGSHMSTIKWGSLMLT